MREKMKSSFRKLRNLALGKQGLKEEASPRFEEDNVPDVAKCMQDAEDLRVKYEGLLTNGQVISGAAYDFSRSLQDMASYMMDTFGEIVDEEIGNIFSILAKVQFEMSKLLDLFAAHVSKTIIKPTETMMNKIQQAEVLREQYDEKQKLYNLLQMEKQKGKMKRGKGNQANQQSVTAKEDAKEQANALNFHMQSFIRGQSQSLVTQAIRYHSAQMHLFSKGFASINAVEPMMKQLAQDKGIDRSLSEEELLINDAYGEVLNNDAETDSTGSSPRHFLEPPRSSSESSGEFLPKRSQVNSKSAPVSPLMYHKKEPTVPIKETSLEIGTFMYALPSPVYGSERWDGNTLEAKLDKKHLGSRPEVAYYSGNILEVYKSNRARDSVDDTKNRVKLRREIKDQLVELQEHENPRQDSTTNRNLHAFAKATKDDILNKFSVEKDRRYTQSGPIIDNPPNFNSRCGTATHTQSGPIIDIAPSFNSMASHTNAVAVHEEPLYKSGPVGRSPACSYATCNVQCFSPPPVSMPQISELHVLPLPPQGRVTPPKSPSHTPSPNAHLAQFGKKIGSPLPSPPVLRSLSTRSSTVVTGV